MLFVRRPKTTVVVQDPNRQAEQAVALAEEQGRASGAVAMLGVTAIVIIALLVGYFAYWAPMNQAAAEQGMQGTTPPAQAVVKERVVQTPGTTTIITAPTPPPTQIIVKEQPAPPVQHVTVPSTQSASQPDRVIVDNTDKDGSSPDVGHQDENN